MPVASVANQKANAGYRLNFKSQLAGMRHKKRADAKDGIFLVLPPPM
jgi:hypothetical protein